MLGFFRLTSPDMLFKQGKLIIIIAVILIAIAIRVSLVLPEVQLIGDAGTRYNPLAQNIVAGNGFSKAAQPPYAPDDFDQPGYPYFLAAIYWLTNKSLKAVVIFQLLIEVAILLFVVKLSRALGYSENTKTIAIGMGLLCPFLPIFSTKILTETIATFIAIASCYLFIRAAMYPKTLSWVLAGVASGLSLLIRPDLVIAIGLMAFIAILLCKYQNQQSLLISVIIVTISAIGVMTPWLIRNYIYFRDIRPLGGVTVQVHLSYVKWLDTWVDDPKYLHPYWWHALDPNSTGQFPPERIPDEQRRRAEQALRMAREQGTFSGEPSLQFMALAAEAKQNHIFKTYILVPVKRVMMTLVRMPTYIQNNLLKILAYLFWLTLLLFILAGLGISSKQKNLYIAIPIGLLVGRLVLPLISSLAVEPRYLLEALPIGFILGAISISALNHRIMNAIAQPEA